MTLTRQQLRLAGCSAVIALSVAVLCLYRPSAWGLYVTKAVARMGMPLFALFTGTLAVGFIFIVFSRYRRKPELLAAALAISAALHLLLAATLSFLEVGTARTPPVERETRFELAPGLPSSTADRIAREMRDALLKPLERETKDIETGKPVLEETPPTPVADTPEPDLEAPERDPSALEAVKPAAREERRVEAGEAPAANATAEAESASEQILKARTIKTTVEPETAVQEPRVMEAQRADVPPVPVPEPDTARPRPDMPVPDRAARVEAPEIQMDHAAPLLREKAMKRAEIDPGMVNMDIKISTETSTAAADVQAPEPTGDRRTELPVSTPATPMTAVQLASLKTPEAPTRAGTAVPQAIPQELPDVQRRDQPDNPRGIEEPASILAQEAVPLATPAPLAEALQTEADNTQPTPVKASMAAAFAERRTPAPAADTTLQVPQPKFARAATAANDESLAAQRDFPEARSGGGTPRILESSAGTALSRNTIEDTASVTMQVSLLQALADAPASTADPSASSAKRSLNATRADLKAIQGGVSAPHSAPEGITALGTTPRPSSDTASLVEPSQARVDYREMPGGATDDGTRGPVQGVRDIEQVVTGLAIRQAPMSPAAPLATGTGATARAALTIAMTAAPRSSSEPGLPGLAVGRPDAPLAGTPSEKTSAAGSFAGTALQRVTGGRSAPAAPAVGTLPAGASASTAQGDAAMETAPVAGRVRLAEADPAPAGDPQGRTAASAGGESLKVERAERSNGVDGSVANAPRPVMALETATGRESGTLIDAAQAGGIATGTTPGRGPAEAVDPMASRRTQDSGLVALPLAALTVQRAPAGDAETDASPAGRSPRAAVFGTLGKAQSLAQDALSQDALSASAAPLRGWKAPPLPAGRGSGVRLSLAAAGPVTERRVEAGVKGSAGTTAPGTVRSQMANDMAGVAAAAGKKAIYELRSPEKRRFIEELGGSPETEEAVEQALVWLAGAQSDDGRWDIDGFKGVETCGGAGDRIDGDVAVTGLSLLAYLGAGYTHMAGKHRETVRKGLEWLIEGQDRDGDLRRGGTMYDQAMATAAICESSSLTGDERLAGAARLAASFIMKAQNPEAAWRYEPRNDNDTSVLGWQILALKSAEISGVEIPPRHFSWAGMWLDQVRKGDGGLYSYKPGHGPTPVMTAEGWFCQLFMGGDAREQGRQESVTYLLGNLPEWNTGARSTVHLYYWYYATLALRLSDAPEFATWNKALKAALLKGRRKGGPAAGSWDPECQLGPRGGRIYSTAMAALCLEVYYRYLPFYRRGTAEQ
jgi:hypothetical protein